MVPTPLCARCVPLYKTVVFCSRRLRYNLIPLKRCMNSYHAMIRVNQRNRYTVCPRRVTRQYGPVSDTLVIRPIPSELTARIGRLLARDNGSSGEFIGTRRHNVIAIASRQSFAGMRCTHQGVDGFVKSTLYIGFYVASVIGTHNVDLLVRIIERAHAQFSNLQCPRFVVLYESLESNEAGRIGAEGLRRCLATTGAMFTLLSREEARRANSPNPLPR